MSVFGVILVHIFLHSDWITPNTDTFHLVLVKNLQSIIFTKIVNDEKLCFWRSTIHNYYKLEVQQVNYNWKHSPLKSTFKQNFSVWTYLITKKKKKKKKSPEVLCFLFHHRCFFFLGDTYCSEIFHKDKVARSLWW